MRCIPPQYDLKDLRGGQVDKLGTQVGDVHWIIGLLAPDVARRQVVEDWGRN